MTDTLRRAVLVETPEALAAVLDELSRESSLGVDTEANSFFVYKERTCLVQVSSRDADFILDPLKVDLAPFGGILSNPAIEKIFHASEFDVLSLRRDYGIQVCNLFDTSLAAKAVGRKKLGLAGLVEESLGVKLAKDEQRSDWGRRPLSKEQVEYAFADTRHLIALAAVLKPEVEAKGFAEEVAVDCERVTHKEPRAREYDPESFEKHPSARKMDPAARQVLRELYLCREARAKETDKPPFRVVSDEALGELAVRKPVTRDQLRGIPGVTPPVIGKHGEALVAAVQRALELGPLPFVRKPYVAPDPVEEERYESLRAWRKQMAEARQVEVEVIAGNAALKALAKAFPKTVDELVAVEELDPYRRSKYGALLVGILAKP